MSRTRKVQRARKAHLPAKHWRSVYGRALKDASQQASADGERLDHDDYQRVKAAAEQALAERGVAYDPYSTADEEDLRTGGVRYGNQRKMRARMDLAARRADRKRDPDPMLDAEGDLALPSRPDSPVRRRGMRWTR